MSIYPGCTAVNMHVHTNGLSASHAAHAHTAETSSGLIPAVKAAPSSANPFDGPPAPAAAGEHCCRPPAPLLWFSHLRLLLATLSGMLMLDLSACSAACQGSECSQLAPQRRRCPQALMATSRFQRPLQRLGPAAAADQEVTACARGGGVPETNGIRNHRLHKTREHCSLGTALLSFKGTDF